MTLAQLKKLLPIGTKLRLIKRATGPCSERRTVSGWTRNGFKVTDPNGRELSLVISTEHEIVRTLAGFRIDRKTDAARLTVADYEWFEQERSESPEAPPCGATAPPEALEPA